MEERKNLEWRGERQIAIKQAQSLEPLTFIEK